MEKLPEMTGKKAPSQELNTKKRFREQKRLKTLFDQRFPSL